MRVGFVNRRVDDIIVRRVGWRGKLLTIYLHVYGKPGAAEQSYHSHPWKRAISIVLWGYIEEMLSGRLVYPPQRFTNRYGEAKHKIIHWSSGAVSLFIGWRRETVETRRDHGNMEPWGEYLVHWSEK